MLITAAVWGTAFVAQRAGMEHVGPHTFNAVRFALGGLSLVPFLFARQPDPCSGGTGTGRLSRRVFPRISRRISLGLPLILSGLAAGTLLFLGSAFQQVGIVYTTAGNAGFITGLYVIIVPIIGRIFGQRPGVGVWIGAALAVAGLYFINETAGFRLGKGDLLVLVSALFFALHVLLIGRLSPRNPAVPLSILQFFTCSLLSSAAALGLEEIAWGTISAAAVPILYGGIGSVGIAYTLQVVGQKEAPPSHAAIILSLESAFALAGGWLILHEAVPPVKLLGCGLMLAGMLSAQAERYIFRN